MRLLSLLLLVEGTHQAVHTVAATTSEPSEGLTLTRFNNTALCGPGASRTVVKSLQAISTGSAAGAMLLTGRLAPRAAGRYSFELEFQPSLAYPSEEAYARLWVNDHLLYPHNTTGGAKAYNAAPRWIPLPPRALDSRGEIVESKGALPLGSYELRVEYVCFRSGGCVDRTLSLQWASVPSAYAPTPPYIAIPSSALLPTQGDPEVARRALGARMTTGWGTWDHESELALGLLPEGFIVRIGLFRISTGAYLSPVGLTVHKPWTPDGHTTGAQAMDAFVSHTSVNKQESVIRVPMHPFGSHLLANAFLQRTRIRRS